MRFISNMSFFCECRCPCSEAMPCGDWADWRCPYVWRPRDLRVFVGSRVEITLPTAKQWTGRLGTLSELHCNSDLQGLVVEVHEVHCTRHYTQVRVVCHQTGLPVWMNVWHRYNRRRVGSGVTWARMACSRDLQREKDSVRSQNGKQRTSDQDGEESAASFSKATPVEALVKRLVRAPDDEKKKISSR